MCFDRAVGARVVVAVAVALAAGSARADDVDDLVARGEELAKAGEWSRAIDAFKAADAVRPRAKHACLVGLAYTRRELWAEAELFLSICHQRATAADPLPEWIDEADRQLRDKLALAGAAAVTIDVQPDAAVPVARVGVSSFAPGESFSPRTIHLAPGTYIITVTAPGYRDKRQDVTIVDAAPRTVTLSLVALRPARSLVPWIAIGGGVALGALGVVLDLDEVQPLRPELAKSMSAYSRYSPAFDAWRGATIGCWIGGALAVGAGVWLLAHHAHVTARVARNGAAIAIGWSR